MNSTPELIESLAAGATPVRRLRPPVARAAGWLLFAALLMTLLAVARGLRPDLALRLQQPVFVVGVAASLATGMFAAVAAFLASIPDRPRAWLWLPAPALALWMATAGYGCLTDWVSIGPGGISLGESAQCFATLTLVGAPLSLAMLIMLRHAALLSATAVAATGSLAVAAISATALSLLHVLDATALILIWNFGTAAALVAFAAASGRRVFSWVMTR
jgi:hypothetical protein